MHFYPNERIALLIDAANMEATLEALELDLDYAEMLEFFAGKGRLVSALYYVSFADDAEREAFRPKHAWLSQHGFTIVTRRSPPASAAESGRRRMRRGISVELAVDALQLAPTTDHLVIGSGEGQLRRLVQALQEEGKRVTVVSTIRTRHPFIADELRRQADQFLDLVDLADEIGGTAPDDH